MKLETRKQRTLRWIAIVCSLRKLRAIPQEENKQDPAFMHRTFSVKFSRIDSRWTEAKEGVLMFQDPRTSIAITLESESTRIFNLEFESFPSIAVSSRGREKENKRKKKEKEKATVVLLSRDF